MPGSTLDASTPRCGPGTALLCIGLLVLGCTEGGGASTSAEQSGSRGPGASGADDRGADAFHRARFDPADFVDPTTSTNIWFPLRPGMQWVRQGTTDVGSREVPHQVISTMTDVIRQIDGVPAIAMLDQDTDAGEVAEESIDYFGLDEDGNVWLLGGYTADFSNGRFANTSEVWLGSGQGAEPGIQMPSDPTRSTPPWVILLEEGGEGTAAEVVETGRHDCVEFACYDGVLVVREGDIGALDNEFKFYAPDVGQILNSPRKDSKQKDVESLVNLSELSRAGLDEVSDEVLRLEDRGRESDPDVFGTSPSTRAP
jgi:hypothetical protein